MKTITFWHLVTTSSACLILFFSALLNVTAQPQIVTTMAHLGYPAYFPRLLGVAKLLGIGALLLPKAYHLKEWAYAGFTFTLIGALIAHYLAGDQWQAGGLAGATLLLVLSSYWLHRKKFSVPAAILQYP